MEIRWQGEAGMCDWYSSGAGDLCFVKLEKTGSDGMDTY